jgi:hypothetical protein
MQRSEAGGGPLSPPAFFEEENMTMNKGFGFVIALALAGCAAAPAPRYQPASVLGATGYLTAPAENGRVSVVYTGGRGMTREQVAQYALLRAAELTTESGQVWFAVINKTSQTVQLQRENQDLQGKSGGVLGGESAGTGSGAAGRTETPRGTSDSGTRGGPSTGGFGGGDVPYQVLERWEPPKVFQTVIVIQMGKGDKAEFPGVTKAPEIFPAQTVASEIRAKMSK